MAEDMVRYIINDVLEQAPEEMKFFDSFVQKGLIERLRLVANSDFKRLTYTQAVELLKKSGKRIYLSRKLGLRFADGT